MQCVKAVIQFAPVNHPIARWARKLKFRKNANIVTVAIARKIIVAIWYILNGFSTPIEELSKMIKTKLTKIAIKMGTKRRKEQEFVNISNFVEVKGEFLLEVT